MPPSVAEWLPEDHLALFVIDVVGGLDISAFMAATGSMAAAERLTTHR